MKDLKSEADRWWRQSQSDFLFLQRIVDIGKYDTVCFLAQQTAEKALKAYLFFKGEELVFTHSIFRLCSMASVYHPAFIELRESVKQLDYYYVEARYPNAIEDTIPAEFYNQSDAEQAIDLTGQVLSLIRPLLEDLPNDEQL
jgi:HEPN domain-containing protein